MRSLRPPTRPTPTIGKKRTVNIWLLVNKMSWFHTHSWKIVSVSHTPRAIKARMEGGEYSGPAYLVDEILDRQRRFFEETIAGKTILGMRCRGCGEFKTETKLGIHNIELDPS